MGKRHSTHIAKKNKKGWHEKGNLRVITSYLLERLHTVENGLSGGSLDLGRLSGEGFAKMQVLSDVEVLVKG